MKKWFGYARMKIERRARWDRLWRPIDSVLRQIETLYWHMRGFTIIECFGDSHVKVMRRLNWMCSKSTCRYRTHSIRGATAYGLGSDKSSSGAKVSFMSHLSKLEGKDRNIFFLLGEVDCGFLIYFLAQKRHCSIEEVLDKSIKGYTDFISQTRVLCSSITVCSVPLPTVDEYSVDGSDTMDIRAQVHVSKVERTQLTLRFNEHLKYWCLKHGVCFLNLDPLSLNLDTGVVDSSLLGKNPSNNHYAELPYAQVLWKEIEKTEIFGNDKV